MIEGNAPNHMDKGRGWSHVGCQSFTRQGPNSLCPNHPKLCSFSTILSLSHMTSPPPSHHISMCIYSLLSGLAGQQIRHHHHHHTLSIVYLNFLTVNCLFVLSMDCYYSPFHISQDLPQLCLALKQGLSSLLRVYLNVGFWSRFHLILMEARFLISSWIDLAFPLLQWDF